MRLTGLGRVLFAVSSALLGAFIVGFPDFAQAWPPVPRWIAWHDTLATGFGALLLAGGAALLVPRTARPAALALAGALLLRLLLMQVPYVAAHPLVEASWYDVSENLTLIAGAWTIFSLLPRGGGVLAKLGQVRAGQIVFALALPAIGLSHMVYLDQTAPLIPSWLPLHVPLAYLTGAAHIAAGAGILFGVLPRLAATLEAAMVSLFTLLVWVPTVIAAPTNRFDWSEICISTAITGAAWAVAESFRGRSWGLPGKMAAP
ncbi:MAG TPA: hypothetical protein VNU97_11815 [Rhizomicrobium sp.]|jgi:uncharacterized membrane protein|nr:hypothetical protein [Rhizomicrobium sp.]